MPEFQGRRSEYPIDPQFLHRWSPRAFTGEPIPLHELMTVFEAAHWAASAYNAQPWNFVYALRDTPAWEPLFGLLMPGNQAWVKDAAALVFLSSNTHLPAQGDAAPKPSFSHSFDAGAAWAQLALQALKLGWHTHAMVGFDHDRAPAVLKAPPGVRVEAAIAIGRLGNAATLPEALRAREQPNQRLPLTERVHEGGFVTRA